MTEDEEKAWRDAHLYGTGFLLDGKHIDHREVFIQMNMKQKMIYAMWDYRRQHGVNDEAMLDAALAVMADPGNWDKEMDRASTKGVIKALESGVGPDGSEIASFQFAAVINHIKGLPS